jgi:hypothetical protein
MRLALVPPLDECLEAIGRINQLARSL